MKFAAQINTVREYSRDTAGLIESCKKIAALGYDGVELESYLLKGVDVAALAAALKEMKLAVCSIRSPFSRTDWDFDGLVAEAKALGCNYVSLGCLTNCYFSMGVPAIEKFIAKAGPVCDKLAAEGLVPMHYVSDHEFIRQKDGEWTLAKLIHSENLTKLAYEGDVLQLVHAGIDPAAFFRCINGRQPVCRFEDQKLAENKPYFFFTEREVCPIGEGTFAFQNWIPELGVAGTEWVTLGQDLCARGPFECLEMSLKAAKKLFA